MSAYFRDDETGLMIFWPEVASIYRRLGSKDGHADIGLIMGQSIATQVPFNTLADAFQEYLDGKDKPKNAGPRPMSARGV